MEDSKNELIELVEKAKNGDKDAFSKLVEKVKYKLYKTGMAILRNDDDTCDAIQETLIQAYQSINTLNNNDFFTTWIIRILINKSYDIIRKNSKVVSIEEKEVDNQNTYYEIYSEESSLEHVLNLLEKDLKLVTVLYYYDDLSVRKISELLNIPEGTVKSRLSRAREKIYTILKEKEGDEYG